MTRTQSKTLRHFSAVLAFLSLVICIYFENHFLRFPCFSSESSCLLSVPSFLFISTSRFSHRSDALEQCVPCTIGLHFIFLRQTSPWNTKHEKVRPALLTLDVGFSTGSASCQIQSTLKAESRPGECRKAPRPATRHPTESSFLK